MEFVARKRVKIIDVLKEFEPRNRFNLDETELFFRLAPNKSITSERYLKEKSMKTEFLLHFYVNKLETNISSQS